MSITTIASMAYKIIVGFNSAKQLFFAIQDLYYDNLFEDLSDELNNYKEKRRALSNAIENANSDDDRRALSIMLAELYGVSSARRGEDTESS